ncbi:MAG TPA: TIGR02757 family protein [Bacteroidia bacterium]|nr:TIGR02757 family protein [Bacteroidia bacterium]
MTAFSNEELYDLLETKTLEYNRPAFIALDPVSIPRRFTRKEDIEIAGFFSATIAWGQRPVIIRNAEKLMHIMSDEPYEFVLSASKKDLKKLDEFVHRTFNGRDAAYFVRALRNIYSRHGGMEKVFASGIPKKIATGSFPAFNMIAHFRKIFLSVSHEKRSEKHLANPAAGSNAKRINMFLRWMVRRDNAGVDFGLWKKISPSLLCCPLDVHVGNVARKLGLLHRKQDDWKSVEELTARLRVFDPLDPAKYDFALFGMGIFEKLK